MDFPRFEDYIALRSRNDCNPGDFTPNKSENSGAVSSLRMVFCSGGCFPRVVVAATDDKYTPNKPLFFSLQWFKSPFPIAPVLPPFLPTYLPMPPPNHHTQLHPPIHPLLDLLPLPAFSHRNSLNGMFAVEILDAFVPRGLGVWSLCLKNQCRYG